MTEQPTLTPRARRGAMWTQDEAAIAASIWQRHFTDHHGEDYERPKLTPFRYQVCVRIAGSLQRGYDSVDYRLRTYGPSFGSNQQAYRKASMSELAARDARAEAERLQHPVSRLMGDPPPGYSELDKRKSACCSAGTTSGSGTGPR